MLYVRPAAVLGQILKNREPQDISLLTAFFSGIICGRESPEWSRQLP